MTPILHVVPSVAARDGGPSAAVAGMCRALQAIGVPAIVATTDADGAGHLDVPLDQDVAYGGMTVRFFRCQASEHFKYSSPLARWLTRHVAAYRIVHVHAVFSHASIAAGRACRRAGVPYVVRPLGTLDPRSLQRHAGRKRIVMGLGARSLLAGAARLHFTSEEEARRARLAMPDLPEGVVIPLGVEEALFDCVTDRQGSAAGPIVTMSRLDPVKGLQLAIEAFHQISERHPDRRLVIAGDGDEAYRRELEARARSGQGADRIEFAGWLAGDARRDLLSRASVFVLASARENFGLAMVEAMASGTPVIISDVLDLAPRVSSASAGWVIPRTVSAMAHALDECLSDNAERNARGRRARAFAEEFRWPAIAGALARLYEGLAPALPAAAVVRPLSGAAR
jgi:glycosyltransferase involved in cell wall biosynthesis